MPATTVETLEFKSELRQILDIITHSLYSHQEIFLRELLSNASDAIDKARFQALTTPELLAGDSDWKIVLVADPAAGTLTISDNGIGMSRADVIENLGTIARSGTKDFLANLARQDATNRPELIGQFGVGFYSAFMVADGVTVVSRGAGETEAVKWRSDGQGEFTIEPAERAARGTDVILHLKEDKKEFLEAYRLKQIVKQYSDFVEHPIVLGDDTLNSMKALWLRPKSEVTQEDYNGFYRQVSGDFEDPAKVIHTSVEGTLEFKELLFIPARSPFDMKFGEPKWGPRLYIRRILVMDHCEALLPPYLRFIRGVVDCADLPLNVSREMLQHNPLLDTIQKNVVKNVLKALGEMKTDEYEKYVTFYRELGSVLKEGVARDRANRDAIADLLLFESLKTERGSLTSLAQYIEKMPEDQKEIYFLTGESRTMVERAPYLEVFKEKGWDVLLLTDPIDEFVLPSLTEYKGKTLKAADRSDSLAGAEENAPAKEQEEKFQPLFVKLTGALDGVKEIRLSRRLKESASCLVSDEGAMGANLERLMARAGRADEVGVSERILELNGTHPAVQGLLELYERAPEDARVVSHARLLHEEAVIAEGSRVKDPAELARLINELLVRDARG
ncbi:MAG: molecular chaperone HtpG [Thermoanaerobaculia bacterium]